MCATSTDSTRRDCFNTSDSRRSRSSSESLESDFNSALSLMCFIYHGFFRRPEPALVACTCVERSSKTPQAKQRACRLSGALRDPLQNASAIFLECLRKSCQEKSEFFWFVLRLSRRTPSTIRLTPALLDQSLDQAQFRRTESPA